MVSKLQRNPCESSAPTSEKMVGCPALLRLLLPWPQQPQFRKEEPLLPRPNKVLGRKGMEALKCKRKGEGLTQASGSELCQIIIHHYYIGLLTALQFPLPTDVCICILAPLGRLWILDILRSQVSVWLYWDFRCTLEQPGILLFAVWVFLKVTVT